MRGRPPQVAAGREWAGGDELETCYRDLLLAVYRLYIGCIEAVYRLCIGSVGQSWSRGTGSVGRGAQGT